MSKPDRATDMELALELAYHIDHPCVEPTTGENIRGFYMRMAEQVTPKMTNPFAIEFLEQKLKEYR